MIFKEKERLLVLAASFLAISLFFNFPLFAEGINALRGNHGNLTKYKGQKVALDFQDAEIKSILRALADVSGRNIVIDPDVKGRVNIRLTKPVPWDQALSIILKTNGLDVEVEGNIIRIANASTMQIEKQKIVEVRLAQEKLLKTEKKARPLAVEIISINYSDAKDISASLDGMLSKADGLAEKPSIIVDKRTNKLIIKDLPEKIAAMKEVIEELDKITRQVSIEARIVETSKNFAREIGIQWGAVDSYAKTAGGTWPRGVTYGGSASSFPSGLDVTSSTGSLYGYAVNMPLTGTPTGGIGLSLGSLLLDRLSLDIQLASMEDSGKGRILSTPRITTLDNNEAIIQSGSKIPYQTISNNTITTTFVDAQIKLTVTPHITTDNMVSMKIIADKSEPNFGRQVNGMPEIIERKASTELIVADGETTVIGGLYKSTRNTSRRKVPWFADLPVIGMLFTTDAKQDTYEELLIFITPKIVKPVFVAGK